VVVCCLLGVSFPSLRVDAATVDATCPSSPCMLSTLAALAYSAAAGSVVEIDGTYTGCNSYNMNQNRITSESCSVVWVRVVGSVELIGVCVHMRPHFHSDVTPLHTLS
jgi:hypothetical protein